MTPAELAEAHEAERLPPGTVTVPCRDCRVPVRVTVAQLWAGVIVRCDGCRRAWMDTED